MIHLRKRILSLLVHSPSHLPASRVSPFFALHHLVSTTASIPPNPFAVGDYLVGNCGITRAQAIKASKKLSHLKSSSKPDAVLAFLSGLGVPRPDIAALVAVDPQFFCASVERTLGPRVTELSDLGLSRSQIARLIPLAMFNFRSSSLSRNLGFWLLVFGSFEMLLNALKMNSGLLATDLDKVVKPNLALLQQCGISACDIASITLYSCRLFTVNPKFLLDAVARVEELGVERGSGMFRRALAVVAFMSKESVARKIQLLQKLGFSRDDVFVIARKAPNVLALSDGKIQRVVEFLMRDVSLEAPYIAQRPVLIMYSLERRLLPRHCLLKVLRAKGLLNVEFDYYTTASLVEKKFVQKFVDPYKDHVPGLADDYTSRCFGKALNG